MTAFAFSVLYGGFSGHSARYFAEVRARFMSTLSYAADEAELNRLYRAQAKKLLWDSPEMAELNISRDAVRKAIRALSEPRGSVP